MQLVSIVITNLIVTFVRVFFMVLDLKCVEAVVRHLPLIFYFFLGL